MIWIALLGLLASFSSFAQKDPQIEALSKRIQLLERQQDELFLSQQTGNQVNSFLKNNLTLGGFFESAVQTLDGPDTQFQSMNTSNLIGLNIAAEFNDNIRFVSQFITGLIYPISNPHNDPLITTGNKRKFGDPFFGALLTQGYLEFSRSSSLRVQAGMGYVPFGYYPQLREPVLYVRRGGPQLIRTNDLFQPLWSGFHLSGNLGKSSHSGFNLYTMNPLDQTNELGLGGRVWALSEDENVSGGLSSQVVKYEGHTSEIVGADTRINWKRMIISAEYALHMTEDTDPWSAYIEPSFRLKDEEFLIYTFADYTMSTRNESTGKRLDPFTKWEFGGGLNWLPTSYTRLRAGVTFHDYTGYRAEIGKQDRDYTSFDFSVGVAF
jgi:hypothetical protein